MRRWKHPCYTCPNVDGAWKRYWRGWLTVTFGCLGQQAADFVSQALKLGVIRNLRGWWLIRHHHCCSTLDSGDGYEVHLGLGIKRLSSVLGDCFFWSVYINRSFLSKLTYRMRKDIWQFLSCSAITCCVVPVTRCLRRWCSCFHLSHTPPL